jgi:hypothetical protein
MDSASLLSGLYYGDEGIKEILVDGGSDVVKVKVTRVTWLEEGKQPWECKLTVEEPWLVFEDAESIRFEPAGSIPNDFVEDISAIGQDQKSGRYDFAIKTGRGGETGNNGPVTILIRARSVSVEHPLWSV